MAESVAELIVRLRDEASKNAETITGKIRSIADAERAVGAASPEMERMQKALATARKGLADVEVLKAAKQRLAQARTEFRSAEALVLASARAYKEAGDNPSRALKRALDTAIRNVKQTSTAYDAAVTAAKTAYQKIGGSIDTAIGAEGRFRQSILDTTAAIEQQKVVMQQAAERQSRMQRVVAGAKSVFYRGGHNLAPIAEMVVGGDVAVGSRNALLYGAQLEEQRNRLYNLSRNPTEVGQAMEMARTTALASPYTTQLQAAKDYGELRSLAVSSDPNKPVDMDRMRNNLMLMAKTRAALASSGYSLGEEEAKQLAQAVEGSGRTLDPKGQEKMLDAFIRAKQVFGNAISAEKILTFIQNAKAANFSMGDDALMYTMFARLAQGNAAKLGNETAQTLSTIGGGHMTKQSAEWLASIGLITPDQIAKGGGGKFYIKGSVKGHDLLSTDPTAWAQGPLLDALTANGVLAPEKVSARADMLRKQALAANPNAQIDEKNLEERAAQGVTADALQKSGFRATVVDQLSHAIALQFQTNKDIEQMRKSAGLGAADTLAGNPIAAFGEFTSAVQNFGAVLTNPIMKNAGQILDGMAKGLSSITGALGAMQKDHPVIAKWLAGGLPAAGLVGGTMAAWNGFSGLMTGFGLKGSAVALDASAAALTEAAVALGGGSMASKAIGGVAKTAGGVGLLSGLWPLAPLLLWDAPHPKWMDQTPGEALSGILPSTGTMPTVPPGMRLRGGGRAGGIAVPAGTGGASGSWVPDPAQAAQGGQKAGQAAGMGIQQGIQSQAAAVESAAQAIIDRIKAVFAQGVNVPIKLNTQGDAALLGIHADAVHTSAVGSW